MSDISAPPPPQSPAQPPLPRRRGVLPHGRPVGSKDKQPRKPRRDGRRGKEQAEFAADLKVLASCRDYWMGVATKEQQDALTKGRAVDQDLMGDALKRAADAAKARAPYAVARLSSVDRHGGQVDQPTGPAPIHITVSQDEAAY